MLQSGNVDKLKILDSQILPRHIFVVIFDSARSPRGEANTDSFRATDRILISTAAVQGNQGHAAAIPIQTAGPLRMLVGQQKTAASRRDGPASQWHRTCELKNMEFLWYVDEINQGRQ